MAPEELSELRAVATQWRNFDAREAVFRLLDALDAARADALEEAAKIAEAKFARIHTYASENSDRYIAMRDAGDSIAGAIRAARGTTP